MPLIEAEMSKNQDKFKGMETNYEFFAAKRNVGHCT